jgi:multidrug efflux pump subunit AcrA (membrane-fusion protein)
MKKILSVVLPLLGVSFAVYWVVISARRPQAAPPIAPPAQSSYDERIAGAGLIEAASRNINVAPPIPGQVVAIFVKENDVVGRGAKLYQIDDRETRSKIGSADANIARAEAAVETAKSDIVNLREAIKSAQANVQSAQANVQSAQANIETQQALLADAEQIRERNEKLYKAGDLAQSVMVSNTATRDAARARVSQAQAQASQARAQVSQAQAQATQAEAQLRSSESRLRETEANLQVLRAQRNELAVTLDRLTVTAPQDGRVLQVNIRLGEVVATAPATPPILLGETDYLQVRVDVDEINASRVKPNSTAVASLKGDATKKIALEFVRIDPFVLPKRSLTGDNTERVDVRVLQVIYRFKPPQFPVYVGQQVDVFIDGK